MPKEILAAGIVRDVRFSSEEDALRYFALFAPGAYRILDSHKLEDGLCIYRVLTYYNNSPLIELYD